MRWEMELVATYGRAHAIRAEGLGDRAQAEEDFAQAQDKLLRTMVNTVLVIGEELTGEDVIYEERIRKST